MEKKNKRKFGENKEKVAKKEERLMVLVSTAQSEAMKKTHQEESEISHWIVAAIYQSMLPKLVGDDFLYCFLTVSKNILLEDYHLIFAAFGFASLAFDSASFMS